ncbi:hypothetical protein [Marivita sp. S2033]
MFAWHVVFATQMAQTSSGAARALDMPEINTRFSKVARRHIA